MMTIKCVYDVEKQAEVIRIGKEVNIQKSAAFICVYNKKIYYVLKEATPFPIAEKGRK